ncbi:SRPBCC domain-containing protein [bacterium]|nr:SRPBCC domain-containing protein [bacterium]
MTDPSLIVIERRFVARLADVWALWTTPRGLESWWGPRGFSVTVQEMDLRPGGRLVYAMTAVDPQMVAFMQANGMPVTTLARITYDEVQPMTRLAYRHLVDFVPGHPPYHTSMVVDLVPEGDAVLVRLTFEPMHDAEWTRRQSLGWESELDKLASVLRDARFG